MSSLSGHAGAHAVAVAQRYGVTTMFTLSGGHVFPLYDGAVKADPPLRLVDVRHEQTAVFAAEGIARLTRTPGLAVVTAGPGVTNSVSAVTSAWFNGAPVVVLAAAPPTTCGARARCRRWTTFRCSPRSPSARGRSTPSPASPPRWTTAFRLATTPHRGPVFVDFPLEAIYGEATVDFPDGALFAPEQPDAEDVARIAELLATAHRPVLVLGSDVWLGGADVAARMCAETLRLPVIANGQATRRAAWRPLAAGHPGTLARASPRPTW